MTMPHLRERIALYRLKKKLSFSRVVSIQGARQTGKSTLARDLLQNTVYATLDDLSTRNEAQNRTNYFLEQLHQENEKFTIVIDEAQKAPVLFDQIKNIVDKNSKPGQFLLLGSTEFSIEAQINESLTGRISRTRLYPLVVSETLKNTKQSEITNFFSQNKCQYNRSDFIRFLKNGGFPAIFSIRDRHEQEQRLDEWIRLTCERDVLQFKRIKPNPEICARILEILPHMDEPSATNLAQQLKLNTKRIQTQLNALCKIFALHKLDPHPLSTGKPLYFLIDPSLASFYRANLMSQLNCAFLTEFMAKQSYQAVSPCRLSYYRNTKGSRISLLIELGPKEILAIKWLDTETIDKRDLSILKSFTQKAAKEKINVTPIALYGTAQKTKIDEILILPWEFAF